MPLTERRTNDLDIRCWSGSGFESLPVSHVTIPPELAANGLFIVWLDHSIPTEVTVVPVTGDNITEVHQLDTVIPIDRASAVNAPSVSMIMQDHLSPVSATTMIQHTTIAPNAWETEIHPSIKFPNEPLPCVPYISVGISHTGHPFFIATEMHSGFYINLGRRIDIIELAGIDRFQKWFSTPTVADPTEPLFDLTDLEVYLVFGLTQDKTDLRHIWVNQNGNTVLIDGSRPPDYERLIRETRRIG